MLRYQLQLMVRLRMLIYGRELQHILLLRDAAYRAKAGAAVIGARALQVHALDDNAQRFYQAHGFVPSPVAPLTLMLAFKHLDT